MSENRFGLPDSMVNPHWLAVWSGNEVRWPSEVGQIVTEHAGQPGAVLVFRYAPFRQSGSVPDRDWANILVEIDDQFAAVVPHLKAVWVPLATGRHDLKIYKRQASSPSVGGRQLGAVEFDVDQEPVVVAITPRRRQGMVPGYTTPRIDVGSPANSAKTASTGDEHQ